MLNQDELFQLRAAVIKTGLHERRDALLIGIHREIAASLRTTNAPGDQVLSDLDSLANVGTLTDGTSPLLIWLRNALALTEPRVEAVVFQNVLNRIQQVNSGGGPLAKPDIPDYPYPEFRSAFRELIAPRRFESSGRILHLVFGSLAQIRRMTVVIPINQDFDFLQRGPRSVLASFEDVDVDGEPLFDWLETHWPPQQRPGSAGLGSVYHILLPRNSSLLDGILFAVTTRNRSSGDDHYGLYVDTPLEGIDYIIDRVLENVEREKIPSMAMPLLGTGYANVFAARQTSRARALLQQTVLALTVHKLEARLNQASCHLQRAAVVVYSAAQSSAEEHELWRFAVKLMTTDPSRRRAQIDALLTEYAAQSLAQG